MKNKMIDLNNHLFEQLERLNDEDLKGDDLKLEMDRAKAITGIASQIIANGQLVLKATIAKSQYMGKNEQMPALLDGDE
jgi:hypothetical protein